MVLCRVHSADRWQSGDCSGLLNRHGKTCVGSNPSLSAMVGWQSGNAAVLKTVERVERAGVRILVPPPIIVALV